MSQFFPFNEFKTTKSVDLKQEESSKGPSTSIPNKIFDLNLTPFELSLYIILVSKKNAQNKVILSTGEISDISGISASKVRQILKSLKQKNLLFILYIDRKFWISFEGGE